MRTKASYEVAVYSPTGNGVFVYDTRQEALEIFARFTRDFTDLEDSLMFGKWSADGTWTPLAGKTPGREGIDAYSEFHTAE
jgi:hypothetical protein